MASFTTKIKNEIAKLEVAKSEMIAELSGFVRNNVNIVDRKIELTTENKNTAYRMIKFLEDVYDKKVLISTKKYVNFNDKELYVLTVNDDIEFILQDLGYFDNMNNYLESPPEYIVGGNEEIRAYLRGVFLCAGSINDPKTSRYHMELLINRPTEAVFIQRLLNVFDLNAKLLTRDKGYMVYLKEAEKISDYLKILKANNAVMYFEDIRIYHDKKNQANRLNNCEQANIDKVVGAATVQMEHIRIIEENMGIDLLDDKTKEALEYRKKYPEASLKELSEIISLETGKPITKSGLNHRFRKLKDLAEKFNNI